MGDVPWKVLVVEDDPDVVRMLEAFLGHAGMQVSVATHGEQAWEMAQAITPDAILVDLRIPRVSGPELIAMIRSHPQLGTTPILAMSASLIGTPGESEIRDVLGADAAISKPMVLQNVLQTVVTLVERRRARQDAPA